MNTNEYRRTWMNTHKYTIMLFLLWGKHHGLLQVQFCTLLATRRAPRQRRDSYKWIQNEYECVQMNTNEHERMQN